MVQVRFSIFLIISIWVLWSSCNSTAEYQGADSDNSTFTDPVDTGTATDPPNCEGVSCYGPPATTCVDEFNLAVPSPIGWCELGECSYNVTTTACDPGLCEDGLCASMPCQGRTCYSPPPNTCLDANTLGQKNVLGYCDGAGECVYNARPLECPAACQDGQCVGEECLGVTCFQPPARYCHGDDLVVFNTHGRCDAGVCAYDKQTVDCGSGGCNGGRCKDVSICEHTSCLLPPAPYCEADGKTLRVFEVPGTCEDGQCNYASRTIPCAVSCTNNHCSTDLCAGVACHIPPSPYCKTQNKLIRYDAPGSCALGECVYTSEEIDCADGCAAGSCIGDPCSAKVCAAPPSNHCDGLIAVSYDFYGSCDSASGQCQYNETRTQCADTCTQGSCGRTTDFPLAAGHWHTCALTDSGGVKCWGYNASGQLGDGTITDSWTPTDVSGLTSGVVALAAGDWHTCALTESGGVKCWGNNFNGQLGDGTTNQSLTPTEVSGLTSGVEKVATGGWHTCALTNSGGVKCWGLNNSGQLGDDTTDPSLIPTAVNGLTSGVVSVATGDWHTCAVIDSGGVKCWGGNAYGQLGDGTITDSSTPTEVSGLTSGVKAVAAGRYHTCALTNSGGVQCWGRNAYGQLGDGTNNQSLTPTEVSGLTSGVVAVAAGEHYTCALTNNGGVSCWGRNASGQLGDGTTTDSLTPTEVSGLTSGVATVAAGDEHTCALTDSGVVECWGWNSHGQLGDGTTTSSKISTDVSGLTSGVAEVATGNWHTCALTDTDNGGVKCWGSNSSRQLGDGTNNDSKTPIDVSGLTSGVAEVAAGHWHTCALTDSGGVKCWGGNFNGQLGDGTNNYSSTPTEVSGLTSGVMAVSAGGANTCALTEPGGGVKCWGSNSHGQLGDGTTNDSSTPADVSGLTTGVAAVATGDWHTCAVTNSGGVKCWGLNSHGRLGDGTTTDSWTPADVSGLTSGVVAVTAGYDHTCALTNSGGVKCWGFNIYGQLGDGTFTASSTPTDVSGLTSGVLALEAGEHYTCAVTSDGGVKCWGHNSYGQLGDGTTTNSWTPTDVSGLTSGVVAVTAGGGHTCALTNSSGLQCWGYNAYGQLGIPWYKHVVVLDIP